MDSRSVARQWETPGWPTGFRAAALPRSTWSTSLSALGALEEVERSRRGTVVLSDR